MKIFKEQSLRTFEFWSGAKTNADKLRKVDLDIIEDILKDLYPNGIDAKQLNDIFSFDFDMILSWLGCPTEE